MRLSKEQKVIAKVIKKCWSEPPFKTELVNTRDPISLIENVTGVHIAIPEGTKMEVVDQTNPQVVYFNIPSKYIL